MLQTEPCDSRGTGGMGSLSNWIRRRIPAKIWRWRWVPTAIGGGKLVHDFFAWMGWWSVIFAVPSAVVSGLLALATPLGAVTLILIVIGLWFFLAFVRFLWWRASFYQSQSRSEAASAAPVDAGEEQPDWLLHELFSYIDPDVLENDRWERVGQQVRDALGLGRVKAWGRVWQKGSELADAQQWPAPEEIPSAYWRRGTFSYTFFDATRPLGEPETYPGEGTGDPKFFDVRVSEAKARQIWPSAPTENAQRVDLLEAATRAYERTRHTMAAAFAESDLSGKGTGEILTWYCWAIWERAPIFGSRPPSRVPEEIPWSTSNSHTFEIEAERLILRDRYRYGSRYENMFVKAYDLQCHRASSANSPKGSRH